MTRQIWSGAAAVLLAASPAWAADLLEPTRLARQSPALTPAAVSTPLTWTGPYAGVHLGAAVADWDRGIGFAAIDCTPCRNGETQAARFALPSGDDDAFLAGVQAGYDLQVGSMVLGVEADFGLTGARARANHNIPSAALLGAGLGAITTPVDGFFGRVGSEVDWLATARGRIGVAAGNLLFYGTGGLAFADARTRVSYLALLPASADPVPVLAGDDEIRIGWTLGAGVEAALGGSLSAKLEYLYADLGRDRQLLGAYIDSPGNLLQFASLDEKLTVHTVKFGLNYRFAGR